MKKSQPKRKPRTSRVIRRVDVTIDIADIVRVAGADMARQILAQVFSGKIAHATFDIRSTTTKEVTK